MTIDKRIDANRQNALKSTGPKTTEGKAAVRLNALKHGLLSRETLLLREDEEALRELGERVRDEMQPVGELDNLLVDRIVSAYWRLSHLGRVEASIFAWKLYREWAMRARQEAGSYTKQEGGYEDLFPEPFQPATTITEQEMHQQAISRARELDAKRKAARSMLRTDQGREVREASPVIEPDRAITKQCHSANFFARYSGLESSRRP